MQLQIITAADRLREKRGAKVLIMGPTGVGKTSLLKTLKDPSRALFGDSEGGDLPVLDLPIPTVRIDSWEIARDLACRIGGPNPSFPATSCYSKKHYDAIGGPLPGLDDIDVLFFDSITDVTRLSFRWAEQQPESVTRNGQKDTRGAYGLHAREMILWLNQLQHAREKHVIFVGILEPVIDDLNRHTEWQLQSEGAKTARELPGIIDNIVTYQFLNFGDD
jgi:hypothetical protein